MRAHPDLSPSASRNPEHRALGGRLLHRRKGGRPGRDQPVRRRYRRVLDRLPGRLAHGPGLSGRLRPHGQRALRLAAALRDLRPRPARLAAALPAGAPGPARDRRGLRPLSLLLQPGQHRRLGAAGLSAAALPARPGALARLPPRQGDRAAALDPDQGAGGDDRGRDRRARSAQRRRRQRDRRRLLRGDRRRPDRRPQADLRQLPIRRPVRRHLRAGRLLRLRPVRAGLPVERHLGRPAGGARGLDLLRPGDDRDPLHARPPLAARPRRDRARHPALLRLGGLPLHRLRARVEHQRRAGLADARRRPLMPDLAGRAGDQPRPLGDDQVRSACAGPAVRDLRSDGRRAVGGWCADTAES